MDTMHSTRRALAPVSQSEYQGHPTDIHAECEELFANMNELGLSVEKALKILWGSSEADASGDKRNRIENLRNRLERTQSPQEVDIQVRLELTRRLVQEDPSMATLADKINALDANAGPPSQGAPALSSEFKELVTVHLEARDKIAAVRDSPFFSYLYLAALEIQGAVTALLSAVFARQATQAETARVNVHKEAKALLRHIHSPRTLHGRQPVPIGDVNIDLRVEMAKRGWRRLEEKLDAFPESIRAHANWPNVKNRMKAYLNHTHDQQGKHFTTLLSHPATSLENMLMSMEIACKLGEDTARKMASQRELWNLAQVERPSAAQNRQVTGWSESFANQAIATARSGEVPEVLKPGKQLALAMDTPMIRPDAEIVEVTILSVVAPALDSSTQPEYRLYARWHEDTLSGERGPTEFYEDAYATSHETIKQQVLGYVRAHPEKKEITLSGVGLGAYLKGLQGTTADGMQDHRFRDKAEKIGVAKLAELAVELRKLGKAVDFTDVNENLLAKVNARLQALATASPGDALASLFVPIPLAGRIPGDWITPRRVIVNAWDTHSLVGNMQKFDNTLDGAIGSSSLVHVAHALRCAMEAEGIRLPDAETSAPA